MDDKTFRKEKRRVEGFLRKWLKPLGLLWWNIEVEYDRTADLSVTAPEGRSVAAKCKVDWQYKQATITFNVPEIGELNDGGLERVVVHELMHIFLNEMRSYDTDSDHEERVASDLASAFLWVRDGVN